MVSEAQKRAVKKWRLNNRDKFLAARRKWSKENRDSVYASIEKWRSKNRDKCLAQKLRYRNKLRQEILNAYGRECVECGEKTEALLQLDHVKNDGWAHRFLCGGEVYTDLRRRGFPKEGYQILCAVCNTRKRLTRCSETELPNCYRREEST